MKKTLSLGIIFVLLLASMGVVSANLVSNGGFESPVYGGSFLNLNAGSAVLAPWVIDSGSIDHIGSYWVSHGPSQSIDLTGSTGLPGSISQTLTTVPGGTYELSFYMAGNPAGLPVTKYVDVYWNGVKVDTKSFDTTGKTLGTMGWTKMVVSPLTATGVSTQIMFKDISGSDYYGAALDDIVVDLQQSTTPVPEFPSMALPVGLIVGLIGAVLFIQKSKEN